MLGALGLLARQLLRAAPPGKRIFRLLARDGLRLLPRRFLVTPALPLRFLGQALGCLCFALARFGNAAYVFLCLPACGLLCQAPCLLRLAPHAFLGQPARTVLRDAAAVGLGLAP
ncbi:hypothetical protein [Massilia sp. Se16.2.3]|uniref:hypothetical protein n=1 Tax=Massilia sp. Se16.2.3 TaxID=2709303 RepID=UPI0015FFC548|nr:hypothetical protein [Massilia sp. Se16.2.3]QNA99640.1 hypothetical protein G4G31_13635 [Massilia sp. Se16.2.3]